VPPRKERIAVVLDTNVIVGYYLSRVPQSANARVFRLWRDQRKLQLIVSDEVVAEYLEILSRLQVKEQRINRLAERLQRRNTVTHVNLGARFSASRDPDDNIMLAVAKVGKVRFLITNDRDLLDITVVQRRRFRFEIVRPQEFLAQLAE
jgi:putative PIN family toxin of toxin-antitoxin system